MSIRSNTVRMGVAALLAAGLAALLVVLLFPGNAETAALQTPSPIIPLASDWDFDGETATDLGEPGITLYDRNVFTPAGANILFVTFSGTGDQHDFAQTLMHCTVDGVDCSGDEFVVVQYFDDLDFHDNSIQYTWCAHLDGVAKHRNVRLRLASSNGGDVFVEQMHFFVSTSRMAHACQEIEAGAGDEAAAAGHGD